MVNLTFPAVWKWHVITSMYFYLYYHVNNCLYKLLNPYLKKKRIKFIYNKFMSFTLNMKEEQQVGIASRSKHRVHAWCKQTKRNELSKRDENVGQMCLWTYRPIYWKLQIRFKLAKVFDWKINDITGPVDAECKSEESWSFKVQRTKLTCSLSCINVLILIFIP